MNIRISATYRRKDEKWSQSDFYYHSHERFEIYHFHSGNCKYLIGDRIYELLPGDVIIMNGLTLHRPNPLPPEPYERSVIEFSPEWIRPIIHTLQMPELLIPFYKLNNCLFRDIDQITLNKIENLIERISINVTSTRKEKDNTGKRLKEGGTATYLIQLLFQIYDLSQSQLQKVPRYESEKDLHVERVVTWIDHHFHQNITLDHIAENLNISKYYMSRIFKEVTGFTIMQYLMNRRMNRAKYLLEMYPKKTILEVALDSGFENSSHFSRFFRKNMKMTPTQFRKENSNAISVNSQEKYSNLLQATNPFLF
ncbi:AraC family transcriptional regulator [Pseudalkalibacillus decolorationis]|uniref:AraC family transcriptional regulator n=1 Tax=Pseudalkalibacillus decolorationis TaxID=163879 RepID=UPI002149732C|nr:AraC family transcriptional regulator [Pseudalkalibacillus decolorationis]